MTYFRKKMFLVFLFITMPIIVLFFNTSHTMNFNNTNVYSKENGMIKYTEKISPLIIMENNNLICDSSTGVCGPPSGWYSSE